MYSIGYRVRFLRNSVNLTMEQLANKIMLPVLDKTTGDVLGSKPVTSGTISNLENDKHKPNMDLILALSDFFDVSTDWLIRGSEWKGRLMDNLSDEETQKFYDSIRDERLRELEEMIKELRADFDSKKDLQ